MFYTATVLDAVSVEKKMKNRLLECWSVGFFNIQYIYYITYNCTQYSLLMIVYRHFI